MANRATARDPKAAAVRLLADHPVWSDRLIADRTGTSPSTVSALRAGQSGCDDPGYRVGLDGRYRPRDAAVGRLRAAELLKDCWLTTRSGPIG